MSKSINFLWAVITLVGLALAADANAAGGGGNTTTGGVILEATLLPGLISSPKVSGDTALITASGAAFTTTTAYVFQRNGGVWQQQAKLVPTDIPTLSYGGLTALNGNTAVVADIGVINTPTGQRSGAIYIFRRTGTIWRQEAKILGPVYPQLQPTSAVSVSGDSVAIGFQNDSNSVANVLVYVRKLSATGVAYWQKQAQLKGSATSIRFGRSVAIDGDTLAAGEESPTKGDVLVFKRATGIWSQQSKLVPVTPLTGNIVDFGNSVALNGDTILVGTQNLSASKDIKRVYVFQRTISTWSEQALLTDPKNIGSNGFGFSLDISGDTAAVADMPLNYGGGGKIGTPGAFDVFKRTGSQWSLLSRINTKSSEEVFGSDVSISGNTLMTTRMNIFRPTPRQTEVYRVSTP
jgi:FG-GAP repeat